MMEDSSTGMLLEVYGPSRILLDSLTRATTGQEKGLGLVLPSTETSTFSPSVCYGKKAAPLGSLSLG